MKNNSSKTKKTDRPPSTKQRDSLEKTGSFANKNAKELKLFTQDLTHKGDGMASNSKKISVISSILQTSTKTFDCIKNTLTRKKSSNDKNSDKRHNINNDSGYNSADDDIWIQNQAFIKNLENFVSKTAEDIMIPRSDIFAVSNDYSLEKLCKIISQNNHTRTLVYKENLDNIIGFIHIKDLFKIVTKDKNYNLSSVLRKHIVCPCSMKLINLFKQMQDDRVHIAIVVDEYGGTDGLITIEDVIEEIVGRIDDEHDHDLENDNFKVIKPGVLIANARLQIEEIEEVLKRDLKKYGDNFDTIGGLVIAKLGNIPSQGDVINIDDDISIEVIDATPRSIKQLKIIFK